MVSLGKACNMLLVALVYSLVVLGISANALVITDCAAGSSPDSKLGTVSIAGCSMNDDSCPLVRGQNASLKVDFEAVKEFKQAKVDVSGKIGIWIPFAIKPDEACGNYGFTCPVKPNDKKTLQISLPIQRTWPRFKVDIKVMLIDENKKPILCFMLPARIVDAGDLRKL